MITTIAAIIYGNNSSTIAENKQTSVLCLTLAFIMIAVVKEFVTIAGLFLSEIVAITLNLL